MAVSKRLCFVLKVQADSLRSLMQTCSRFMPNGARVLNRTEWRGKEPRSCAVTRVHGSPVAPGPFNVDIEVTYRPKGYTSYTGHTKYDGWDAMVMDEDSDPPADVRRQVYDDVEFNDLDFGEFVGEFDVEGVRHVTAESVYKELEGGDRGFNSSDSTFVAAHRSRPLWKIVLSRNETGQYVDGFGARVLNINSSTPNIESVIAERITELMCAFVEGKASIKNEGNDEMTFVELSDSFVDCGPNEDGLESWFDTLHLCTPAGFLEDLAKRLMAVYAIEVAVVDGEKCGLVLRREREKK